MVALPDEVSPTVEAIYRAYETNAERGERHYLGMSTFGTECDRALWYQFRWAIRGEQIDGRALRLFKTGHLEEHRFIADLESIGVTCHPLDPSTNEQWAVEGVGGHLKGHMDGKATGIIEAPKTEHLLEFKTHNEKSFRALVKDGVEKSKPGHFAQMQLYMHFGHMDRAFYLAVNKNTDELWGERVKYDATKALILLARAENIIRASEPPPKLHEDPEKKAAWQCRFCSAKPQCHEKTLSRANCRTCLHVSPIDGGWHCGAFDRMLSVEEQRTGCSRHLFIPALVPGEQIDADEVKETVTYKMIDGSVWVDGAQPEEVAA